MIILVILLKPCVFELVLLGSFLIKKTYVLFYCWEWKLWFKSLFVSLQQIVDEKNLNLNYLCKKKLDNTTKL